MSFQDWIPLIAYPLSGVIAVIIARVWKGHQRKLKETADYAAKVFEGWHQLTKSYGSQLRRVEHEVKQLRGEILQLKIQLVTVGCGRDACNIRIPTMVAGIPQPRNGEAV